MACVCLMFVQFPHRIKRTAEAANLSCNHLFTVYYVINSTSKVQDEQTDPKASPSLASAANHCALCIHFYSLFMNLLKGFRIVSKDRSEEDTL